MKKLLGLIIFVVIATFILGCGQKGDETIKLGATFSLTGDNASYGQDAKSGITLAMEEINAAGGIRDRKIEVVFEDNRTIPKLGIAAMKKLVDVEKVPLVMGADGSNVTLAIAPIANRTKTVLISPISSAAEVTEAGKYVFRTCPSDAFQSIIVAKWLLELGYNTAGVLYVNNSWGMGLKKTFIEEFKEVGGKIVAVESSNETDTDFRTQLINLSKKKPKALFMPTYAKQGARILRQRKELGIDVPTFGADCFGAPELVAGAGDAADGVYFTVPEEFKGDEYQKFATKYKAKYGKEPDFNAASAYDVMNIVALAIGKVLEKNQKVTGENLQLEISKIKGFRGATGITTFDENGDVTTKSFAKKIIRGGKYYYYEREK